MDLAEHLEGGPLIEAEQHVAVAARNEQGGPDRSAALSDDGIDDDIARQRESHGACTPGLATEKQPGAPWFTAPAGQATHLQNPRIGPIQPGHELSRVTGERVGNNYQGEPLLGRYADERVPHVRAGLSPWELVHIQVKGDEPHAWEQRAGEREGRPLL